MKRTLELAEAALCDAAQFIDAVKQDAIREGWWSEWDGQMRQKITDALISINAHKEPPKTKVGWMGGEWDRC